MRTPITNDKPKLDDKFIANMSAAIKQAVAEGVAAAIEAVERAEEGSQPRTNGQERSRGAAHLFKVPAAKD